MFKHYRISNNLNISNKPLRLTIDAAQVTCTILVKTLVFTWKYLVWPMVMVTLFFVLCGFSSSDPGDAWDD